MIVKLPEYANNIPPIPSTAKRPLWSVMIPTYNPVDFIYKTIESILIQHPGLDKMEIEVVDDCSPDVDVKKIIENIGDERVKYFRQPNNIGHSFNFTDCIRRSKGQLIHILHEDDMVKPGFYSTFENIFDKYENIGAAYCRQAYIDEDGETIFYSEPDMEETGILDNALIRLAEKVRMQYCGVVVRRSVYEHLGGFITKNIGSEDWEMWVRIAKYYPVAYEPQALAEYRIHHGSSMTLRNMRTGLDMRNLQESINIFNKYLPKENRAEVDLFRRRHYADYSFKNAKRLLDEFKDEEGAAAQISETIKLNSELVYNDLEFISEFKHPVESTGVSVVVNCRNDEKLITGTLLSLINQRVPPYIPWEIILIDNSSNDNTITIARETWNKFKGKIPFKIIKNNFTDPFNSEKLAFENAAHNFVLFCHPGEVLSINYIRMVSENMMQDMSLGVLTALSQLKNKNLPEWFDDEIKKDYQIGSLPDFTGDVTWSGDFAWNSGLAIRKEAWQSLLDKNFNSNYGNNQHKDNGSGFNLELCYALRLDGWKIWYNPDLILNRILPDENINWRYLRNLNKKAGAISISLSPYLNLKRKKVEDFRGIYKRGIQRDLIKKTYRKLRRFKNWKLSSYSQTLEGDKDLLQIEYNFGRLSELLKDVKLYNRKVRILRAIARKKDFKFLKYAIGKTYFRFPQYKKSNDSRGISVILNYENSTFNLLLKSLENISKQKVAEGFPWEVIVVTNSIKDDVRKLLLTFWEKSNCQASLRFVTINSHKNPFNNLTSVKSRYKYLIHLNENHLIYPDYVRIAYKIIHHDKTIGILGGQTELEGEVYPPKWFNRFKGYYRIGKQSEKTGDIATSKGYLWRPGIIVRKQVLEKIYHNTNFQSSGNNVNPEEFYTLDFCAKVKLAGWKLWYEPRLKLKHFIPVKQFRWEYLRSLAYSEGMMSERNETLSRIFANENGNGSNKEKSWLVKANQALSEIRNYPIRKIFSAKSEYQNDEEIIEIEHRRGQFAEIIAERNDHKTFMHQLNGNINGNYSGIYHNANDHYDERSNSIKGISIIISCHNSSRTLPQTLKYVCTQDVPAQIPWEVIVIDNGSTDNTYEIAKKTWYNYNCLASFIPVRENIFGQINPLQKGFSMSKYEYVILCEDNSWLGKDFVKQVYEIMSNNNEIGALGGQFKIEFDSLRPKGFSKWKNTFSNRKQIKLRKDLTWTKGYIEGALILRKSALEKSISINLEFPNRTSIDLTTTLHKEICYRIRNHGWKIWHDPRLKSKKYLSGDKLNWGFLRKSFYNSGQTSADLDDYLKIFKYKFPKKNNVKFPAALRIEIHKAVSILRNAYSRKLFLDSDTNEGNKGLLKAEYTAGRLKGLLRKRETYNRGIKQLKKATRKNDLHYLKFVFGRLDKNFPRYKIDKKLNGVSVIVCTYNGAERLGETIKHLARQKVNSNILWEVILVDNASTDNSKEVTKAEWDKHGCNARFRLIDQPIPGKQLALEKGYEVAKYEFLITCDDDNWLEENFVQIVYDIMSTNERIGALGGPNEPLCEIEPPDWFKYLQKDYAAGQQGDIFSGKVALGNITWKRGFVWGAGMIVRKSAWDKLISDGFKSSMSCRKGSELTSGGDSEACYALSLAGWEIWYDSRLKLKHLMPAGRLIWDYLLRLFIGFGVASVGLDRYEKAIKLGRVDINENEINRQDWWYEVKRTIREIRKYGIKKILSLRFPQNNNTGILMLEYNISRLRELLKVGQAYNKNFEEIKSAPWKKSYSELRANHRKFVEAENNYKYGWPWSNETASVKDFDIPKKELPKISILSPSYNSVGTIEKAVLSVLKQNYPNFEHIICDAGSKDGTVEVLKKFPHLKWISESDKGQSDAMNKAFAMSTGEIVVYLNVDDYFQRGVFYKIAKSFKENPAAEMVVGNLFFEYSENTFMRKPEIEYKKIMLPFRYIFPINPVSYFYKRKIQEEIGPFPLDNHFTMDYWFLLKAYQNYHVIKQQDFFGTFCMNGYNKTSNADNRKNTHHRVLYHCWNYDRKKLLYYLYNYYKFFYFDRKVDHLKSLIYRTRKNILRGFSLFTLKKNKYYSERLYELARLRYYENKKLRSVSTLITSFLIYPKGLIKRSRWNLLLPAVLGKRLMEKLMIAYRFLAFPPGMPLSHKLYYYGNEYRKKNQSVRGNLLILLTYIISPSYIFRKEAARKPLKVRIKKSLKSKRSNYLFPLSQASRVFSYFKYKKYKIDSEKYFERACEKIYFHKRTHALFLLLASFLTHPYSFGKKSRLGLIPHTVLSSNMAEKLRLAKNFLVYPKGMSLAHKLNYYGHVFKEDKKALKGSLLLAGSYFLSPSYIFNRKEVPVAKSISPDRIKTAPFINPFIRLNRFLAFFRYRKYKIISDNYYQKAKDRQYQKRKLGSIGMLLASFIIYPPGLMKKSRLSLLMYSSLNDKSLEKLRNTYNFFVYPKEMSLSHKLNYYGREFKKSRKLFKGNSLLAFSFILSPGNYLKKYEAKVGNNIGKSKSGIFNTMRNISGELKYKAKLPYYFFKYRKYKAKSKTLYLKAQESYHKNRKITAITFLIPSFLLYPVSILNRNKWSLMIHSFFSNTIIEKFKGGFLGKIRYRS